ncbi:CD209 antigen-like protein 2 [Menidia menidia]
MDAIYANAECGKPVCIVPTTGSNGDSRRSKRSIYLCVTFSLGLLMVLLLAGLIVLGAYYHNSNGLVANLSAIKDNLTERLQTSNSKLDSIREERDLLLTNLTKITEELNKQKSLSKQKKTCPTGWKMFSCSCYLVSSLSGTWDKGREDCNDKGADLVVIDTAEEQKFVSGLITSDTWIGLSDRNQEGLWQWVDNSPLSVKFWDINQPDNGGRDPKWGEEDCAHFIKSPTVWNDISCTTSFKWICEKIPDTV